MHGSEWVSVSLSFGMVLVSVYVVCLSVSVVGALGKQKNVDPPYIPRSKKVNLHENEENYKQETVKNSLELQIQVSLPLLLVAT